MNLRVTGPPPRGKLLENDSSERKTSCDAVGLKSEHDNKIDMMFRSHLGNGISQILPKDHADHAIVLGFLPDDVPALVTIALGHKPLAHGKRATGVVLEDPGKFRI